MWVARGAGGARQRGVNEVLRKTAPFSFAPSGLAKTLLYGCFLHKLLHRTRRLVFPAQMSLSTKTTVRREDNTSWQRPSQK